MTVHWRRLAALLVVALAACAPIQSVRRPPPTQAAPDADWQYGIYLLAEARDPGAAQGYFTRAEAEGVLATAQASLFYRDTAEAHLFGGDPAGAAVAAHNGIAALVSRPTTAQFQPDDRSLFERDLSALEAAGRGDVSEVQRIAAGSDSPPSADPWYLLAWTRERNGDTDGARAAYARYLELTPAWTFLRSAPAMRAHAEAMVSS